MSTNWWIDGNALFTRHRSGGAIALKGFEFQKAYARLRLVWLLTGKNGIVEVRYEGAQDIDVRYGDGSQQFVQAKDYAMGNLTLSAVYDVLAGFARDLIYAKDQGCQNSSLLRFTLVSTTPPVDDKSLELYRGVFFKTHASEILTRIASNFRYGLDEKSTFNAILETLDRTKFEVVHMGSPCADLEAIASWELIKFGVPLDHVSATLSRIGDLLKARASLHVEDVAAVLGGLPSRHPAHASSPCRLLPSRDTLAEISFAKNLFLKGAAPSLWAAVANNLDVRRTAQPDIESKLLALVRMGGMLVIEGAAGTGKSTLARRTAWDLHRQGEFVALEAQFPASLAEDDWQVIVHICEASDRPLLIVVDDVWRHAAFLESLDRNVRARLCVLATSRPGEQRNSRPLRLTTDVMKLGKLEHREIESLRDLVGLQSIRSRKQKPLQRLVDTGQIFIVSLILQSGSLEEYATHLIEPLKNTDSNHLEGFIDLCVCGMHDHTIPKRILLRRMGGSTEFWRMPQYADLVFDAGDGGDRLRLGHALVGTAVIQTIQAPAVKLALSICKDCDLDDAEERRFALRLISNLVYDPQWLTHCIAYRSQLIDFTARVSPIASYTELIRLVDILERLKCKGEAVAVKSLVTGQRIRGGPDVWLAMSHATPENFEDFFEGALTFYREDSTAYAKRKFLLAVMTFGATCSKEKTAEHMSNWLKQQGFPAQETRILFDLCKHASRELSEQYSWLVGEYARALNVTMATSLAAIRLLERAKDGKQLQRLEERLVQELCSSPAVTIEAMEVAIQLTNARQRLNAKNLQPALYEIVMEMCLQAPTRLLRVRLVNSAIRLAGEDQRERLLPIVLELTRTVRSKKAKNCAGLFASRFPASK
jgi:hypothetical protein